MRRHPMLGCRDYCSTYFCRVMESDTYGTSYYIDYFLLQEIREGNIRPSQGFASGPTSALK